MKAHLRTIGVNLVRTQPLREKLLAEISEYERLMQEVRGGAHQQDFGLVQTYREMVQARKQLLHSLPSTR